MIQYGAILAAVDLHYFPNQLRDTEEGFLSWTCESQMEERFQLLWTMYVRFKVMPRPESQREGGKRVWWAGSVISDNNEI